MRTAWWWAIGLCGCAPNAPAPLSVCGAQREAPAAVVAERAAAPQYSLLPLPEYGRDVSFGDDRLRLYDGSRIEQTANSLTVADTMALPVLLNGRPLPRVSGGGFLFWNQAALYSAVSFLGELRPFAATGSPTQRVQAGPGYVVVDSLGAGRLFLEGKTGARLAPTPLGVLAVAAAEDGRVVSKLQFGRYTVSLDGNATTREVQAELPEPVASLSEEPLGFVLQGGALLELSKDGKLQQRNQPPPQARLVPGWGMQQSALERAVKFGIPRGAGRALVANGSALAEVDLASGQPLRTATQLLPNGQVCELAEQGSELLMVCDDGKTLSVVNHPEGQQARVEQTFPNSATLRFGRDKPAFADMSCDGRMQSFDVCVREPDGAWHDVTAPASATKGLEPPVAYGARRGGSVVAFVDEPKSRGYLDLKTGKLTPLAAAEPLAKLPGFGDCEVERDGSVRCFSWSSVTVFGADGKPSPEQRSFRWLGRHEDHVLAIDAAGAAFQSDDRGKSWQEVDVPNLIGPPGTSDRCSAVGCVLSGWLRRGWEPRTPRLHQRPRVLPGLNAHSEQHPRLSCESLRDKRTTRSSLPALTTNDSTALRYVARIETRAVGDNFYDESVRGVLLGERRTDPALPPTAPFEFWFRDYFDVNGRIQRATLPATEAVRAARSAGAPLPTSEASNLKIVPVLGREPGSTAGFVSQFNRTTVWVQGAHARALPLGASMQWAVSALVDGSGNLNLLMADGSVLKTNQESLTPLLQVPDSALAVGRNDALGIGPQGELAVLRIGDYYGVPAPEAPAVAYRPGQAPLQLAPWRSAVPASDKSCAENAGYRAILVSTDAWLDADYGDSQVLGNAGMAVMVRWSPERVCVEAVEMPDGARGDNMGELETRIIARFGAKPAATRVSWLGGVDSRQTLSCSLQGK